MADHPCTRCGGFLMMDADALPEPALKCLNCGRMEPMPNPKEPETWSADLLVCPSCHHEMIDGFSEKPIAIRSDTDFLTEILKAVDSGIQLFDFYLDPSSLNSEPNPPAPADIHWQRVLEECPRPGSTIDDHRSGKWCHVVMMIAFPNLFGPVCILSEVFKRATGHLLTQSQTHAIRTDDTQSKRAARQ